MLRLPPGAILLRFHERERLLAWMWCAFAAAALAFAPVAAAVDRAMGQRPGLAGQASAVAQFIGLMRWPMLVPLLAKRVTEPAQAATAELVFVAMHQVLGEILGQILLVAWTLRVVLRLRSNGQCPHARMTDRLVGMHHAVGASVIQTQPDCQSAVACGR